MPDGEGGTLDVQGKEVEPCGSACPPLHRSGYTPSGSYVAGSENSVSDPALFSYTVAAASSFLVLKTSPVFGWTHFILKSSAALAAPARVMTVVSVPL